MLWDQCANVGLGRCCLPGGPAAWCLGGMGKVCLIRHRFCVEWVAPDVLDDQEKDVSS